MVIIIIIIYFWGRLGRLSVLFISPFRVFLDRWTSNQLLRMRRFVLPNTFSFLCFWLSYCIHGEMTHKHTYFWRPIQSIHYRFIIIIHIRFPDWLEIMNEPSFFSPRVTAYPLTSSISFEDINRSVDQSNLSHQSHVFYVCVLDEEASRIAWQRSKQAAPQARLVWY